jgi:hypothetical protein
MTTVEKIDLAKSNKSFILFKEGLFYKCYNQDAMVFVKYVREYKVSCKYIKSVGSKVYSIGFPASEVEKVKLSFKDISTKIGGKRFEVKSILIVFYLKDTESKKAYKDWVEMQHKNKIVMQEPETIYPNTNKSERVLAMIRNYDLANSTPIDGLLFIQNLKEELD